MSTIYGKAQLVIYKEKLYKKERKKHGEKCYWAKSCEVVKEGGNGNWMREGCNLWIWLKEEKTIRKRQER